MNVLPVNVKCLGTSKLKSRNKSPRLSRKLELLDEAFRIFARENPNPRTELYFLTEFQLLLSVMLSAQTTDKAVNAAVKPLYDSGFGPDELIKLGEKGFLNRIKTIGLAPTKARRGVELALIIKEKFQGKVPRTREELESLPGVGRKTANVVLAEIWQEPTLAVDTHVFRVTKRLGLHAESSPEKAEQELLKIIDPKFLPMAHHWFILHGRYTCKAIKPKCGECFLRHLCPSVAQL